MVTQKMPPVGPHGKIQFNGSHSRARMLSRQALHRDFREARQFQYPFYPCLFVNEGIFHIYMPASAQRVIRAFIEDPAIACQGSPFGENRSSGNHLITIREDFHAVLIGGFKEDGKEQRVTALAQNQVRVVALDEFIECANRLRAIIGFDLQVFVAALHDDLALTAKRQKLYAPHP